MSMSRPTKSPRKMPFSIGEVPRPSLGYTRFTTALQFPSTTTSLTAKPPILRFTSAGPPAPQKTSRQGGVSSMNRPVTVPSPRSKRTDTKPAPSKFSRNSSAFKTASKSPRNTTTVNVVFPARRMSSDSSVEERQVRKGPGAEPVLISSLHHSTSYTPHKSYWIKKALESLGGEWVRQGKITNTQLVSEEFEEKMGVLYDLAMARKHEAIDRLVADELDQIGLLKKLKKSPRRSMPHNFPFAPHITGHVKESMSEALLRIMMRGDEIASKVERDRGDSTNASVNSTPPGPSEAKEVEDASSSTTNSFDKDLKVEKRSLLQCYVVEGKLVAATDRMLSMGGSIVNKYEDAKKSRVKQVASASQLRKRAYFRATCNMMGFLPHEVVIRYCDSSKQLIVSAARPKRGNDNARQVRETIQVPKKLDLFGGSILVMRTHKGSLIFEEIEEYP